MSLTCFLFCECSSHLLITDGLHCKAWLQDWHCLFTFLAFKGFFFLDLDLDSERVEGPHISILSFNSIEGWILVFVQSLNAVKEAALESNRRTGAST